MNKDKTILQPLIEKVLKYSSEPIQEERKKLWADHQALKGTNKIPISVYWQGIPKESWFGISEEFKHECKSETAIEIEFWLKRVIYMAENIPDDHIVWPTVFLNVPKKEISNWGIPLNMEATEEKLGAHALSAYFKDKINLNELRKPEWIVDEDGLNKKMEEAESLLNGQLDIYKHYWSLDYSPFDVAANMCGLESIMMAAILDKENLHGLMDFITNVYLEHHKTREEKGWLNFIASRDKKYQIDLGCRTQCSYLPEGFNPDIDRVMLKNEWPYVSAQTSSGYGPDMYKEFVHGYNVKLAELFTDKTVYYHGCEPLDQKYEIIKELPNLRRCHVSPWSNLDIAVEVLKGEVVMEVHSHPSHVFFSWGEDETRKNIRDLIKRGNGLPMDLNLSDVHTVNNKPEMLATWSRIAQEEVAKASNLVMV